MSTISNLSDQHVDQQASGEKEFVTQNREDSAIFTPVGDVQYDVTVSTKGSAQEDAPQETLKMVRQLSMNE